MNKWVPGLLLFGGLLMMASLPFAIAIAASTALASIDVCSAIALTGGVLGFVLGLTMVGRGAILASRGPENEKAPND